MTATPSPSGVVRELVPRVARVVRPTARMGFWGNGRGFPALSLRSLTGSRARARIKRQKKKKLARNENTTGTESDDQPTNPPHPLLLLRGAPPFATPCAPPRSLLHPPSRRFQKGLEGGRSSSLAASHRASTNWERAAPLLPLLTKCDDDPAEDSRGRNSGGRFRREKFGREISFCAPAGAFAAATPLPSPVPRRSWLRGACKMAFVGREVAKMVVGNVSKVASWCEWRGC